MSSSTLRATGCNASCSRLATARSTRRAVRMVVRAEGEVPTKTLDLSMNDQAVTGYVEKDTAGQSNMYPVVTKPFEAGSSNDTSNNGLNLAAAGGAAVAALGAIALGLAAVSTSNTGVVEPTGQYRTLAEYKDLFAAEN